MNLLAIETSSLHASVSLFSKGQWFYLEETKLKKHTEVVLTLVKQVLDEANASFEALDGVVFGEGPGSFTGLRVACSVAKGLAYAYDLPLYPVSSLKAIIFDAERFKLPVLAMIDARMREVYWVFDDLNAEVNLQAHVSAPSAVSIPAVKQCVLAGLGFEPYIDELPEVLRQKIIKQVEIIPRADTMIKIVQTGCVEPVSAENAVPMYIRNQVVQEAQVNKQLFVMLACPLCRGALEQKHEELVCGFDRLAYPIRDGIPVMLEKEARILTLEEKEAL